MSRRVLNIFASNKFKKVFFIGCLALFIVPQIIQQFILDQLPITGDIWHKRIVYLFSNFPNFHGTSILQEAGRPEMAHHGIAFFNIVTGLTMEKAFYGFAVVNFIALGMVLLLAWIFAKKMAPKYAFLAPLLLIATPSLVAPMLGQSDLHLVFIFMGMASLTLLFLSPTPRAHVALLILLTGAANAHFMPWIVIFLTLLMVEGVYPRFKALPLFPLGIFLSWKLIQEPLAYISDVDGKILFWAIVASFIGAVLFYGIKRIVPKLGRPLLILCGVAGVAMALIPQEGDPVYLILATEKIREASQTFKTVNPWNFIFSINPNKGIPGVYLHSVLFFMTLIAGTIVLRKKRDKRFKTLFLLTLIPSGVILLQLIMLKINFKFFILSPLGALLSGRVSIIGFFLGIVVFIYILNTFKHKWLKPILVALVVILVVSAANVSQFFYKRVSQSTSQAYQEGYRKNLEEGNEQALSYTEAQYSCYAYNHCDLKSPDNFSW